MEDEKIDYRKVGRGYFAANIKYRKIEDIFMCYAEILVRDLCSCCAGSSVRPEIKTPKDIDYDFPVPEEKDNGRYKGIEIIQKQQDNE